MKNYRVSNKATGIERYKSEDHTIISRMENGVTIFEIYHGDCSSPAYHGSDYETARRLIGFSHWDFENLLHTKPDFLQEV